MPIRDRLKSWLREPLVHFLIGGLFLWLFLAWQGEEADPASRTISITQEDRARMALQWQRMMQRPPTDAELDGLTQSWLREEILYREALRLGLDREAHAKVRPCCTQALGCRSVGHDAAPSGPRRAWRTDRSIAGPANSSIVSMAARMRCSGQSSRWNVLK